MTSAAWSAAAAASCPLLPALPPARSTACCMVSTVSTPNPTGSACAHRHRVEAARRLAGHVVEVRRVAPDDRAERHEAGVAPGARGRRRRHGKLERARHPHDVDRVSRESRLRAARERAFEQPVGDQLVVAAGEDRHAPHGAEAKGEIGHGQWARRWPSLSRLTCRYPRFSWLGSVTSGTRSTIWSP